MHLHVHSTTIHNSQDMETLCVHEQMDKEDTYIHIHIKECYSAIGKNEIICSNMDGTRDYHSKWNKSEREKQILYDITYMRNLKYDTNEHINKAKIDLQT